MEGWGDSGSELKFIQIECAKWQQNQKLWEVGRDLILSACWGMAGVHHWD